MSHQHTHIHTHTLSLSLTHTHTNSTQPDTLSHQLDTYTLPKPNETATTHSNNYLDTVHILAQLAQRADHEVTRTADGPLLTCTLWSSFLQLWL